MTLALSSLTACAQESQVDNVALGAWARSQPECKNPELKFSATKLNISIDADGTPTSFEYPGISYQVNSQDLLVLLNKQHPYSKTPKKDALNFKILDKDTIALQQLKNKETLFVRCAN